MNRTKKSDKVWTWKDFFTPVSDIAKPQSKAPSAAASLIQFERAYAIGQRKRGKK